MMFHCFGQPLGFRNAWMIHKLKAFWPGIYLTGTEASAFSRGLLHTAQNPFQGPSTIFLLIASVDADYVQNPSCLTPTTIF